LNTDLIKQTKSGFKKNIKDMLKNTWILASLIMSVVMLAADFKLEVFSILSHLLASVAFGFAIACSFTFPVACISVFQYFTLKQKLLDNEHMKSSTFVKVSHGKNISGKIGEFIFGVVKVNILELNGKKLSKPLRAVSLYKPKKNQNTGSIIHLPISCFYIPHSEVQNLSSKKSA
jgi:hypothetical protein